MSNTPSKPRRLLRHKETAAILDVSPRTLWSLANSGQIVQIRFGTSGRTVRYDPDDIEAWISAHKRRGGRPA